MEDSGGVCLCPQYDDDNKHNIYNFAQEWPLVTQHDSKKKIIFSFPPTIFKVIGKTLAYGKNPYESILRRQSMWTFYQRKYLDG